MVPFKDGKYSSPSIPFAEMRAAASGKLDGGTMVERIEIKDNKIHLYGADPMHHRTISKPLIVTSSVFERCRSTAIPGGR